MSLLEITNLHARVEDHPILKGLSLTVNPGEVHAIMGPNGSGKSTLASVLAGREDYEVTEGTVVFDGADIAEMAPEERAREGLFLAFQYPIELPGVSHAPVPPDGRQRGPRAPRAGAALGQRLPDAHAREGRLRQPRPEAHEPLGQRGLLGRREEARRDLPDGHAGPAPRHPRRDRLGPRHRRAARRLGRRQQAPLARALVRAHHALPAPAGVRHARLRARARQRPDRPLRRPRARPRARGARLRLAARRGWTA